MFNEVVKVMEEDASLRITLNLFLVKKLISCWMMVL